MAKTLNPGFDDAQSVNQSSKTTFLYKDISLYFTKNPVTGDVTEVTDVQDIKRAVRNLVLTNRFDHPFHPEIASRVRESLFEMFTPITVNVVRNAIIEVLTLYEPRVTVTNVEVADPEYNYMDQNTLPIKIYFTIHNAPETLEEVNVVLERIR
jgi:phage baseplate assembly protein W